MGDPTSGRFTWHELMTTDIASAMSFYTELFGWTALPTSPAYCLLKQGDKPVGGIAAMAHTHVPAHWLAFVDVDDVDASSQKIAELGGRILLPPTEVPNLVRFARGQDPEGAVFGISRSLAAGTEQTTAYDVPTGPGTFAWDELQSRDRAAATTFYGGLFGWTVVAGGDETKVVRWTRGRDGKDVGGMRPRLGADWPPNWLPYIGANDIEASTKLARDLGGELLVPATESPGIGRFAVIRHAMAGAFALFTPARA